MKQSQRMEIKRRCISEGNDAIHEMHRNGNSSTLSGSRKTSIADIVLKMASAKSTMTKNKAQNKKIFLCESWDDTRALTYCTGVDQLNVIRQTLHRLKQSVVVQIGENGLPELFILQSR